MAFDKTNTGPPQRGYRWLPDDQLADVRVRLAYCYEPVVVADIVADRDPAALADLGHWRRLCSLARQRPR